MREILGNNLETFFNNVEVLKSEVIGRSYKGKEYEVWSISESLYERMWQMSEERFIALAGENAWWRSTDGCILGAPFIEYKINKKNLIAWDGLRRKDYEEECHNCFTRRIQECNGLKPEYEECFPAREYSSLTTYFCEELGCSQPRNICALAVDLAKHNNMTMGQLFEKYEG